MEQDSGSPSEEETDAEAEEIKQCIAEFSDKRQKKSLLHWIKRTKDKGSREKKVWLSIQYFSELRDFDMMRKVAKLEFRAFERATALYLVAQATGIQEDTEAARKQLLALEASQPDPTILTKVGFHFVGLFQIMGDPSDLVRAGRIGEWLLEADDPASATDVFFDMMQAHPVAGLYRRALDTSLLIKDNDERIARLNWFCEELEVNPPDEDLVDLVSYIFLNQEPRIAHDLKPFITDRLAMSLYCHLLNPKRFPGRV